VSRRRRRRSTRAADRCAPTWSRLARRRTTNTRPRRWSSRCSARPDNLSRSGWGSTLNHVLAGLITLAFVGMLQSLGALAETVPVDPTWGGDACSDTERGHAAGRGPSSHDAIGPVAV